MATVKTPTTLLGEPEEYTGATAQDKVEVHVLGCDQITRENFRVKLQAQAELTGGRDAEGLPLGFFLNGILLGKTVFDEFGVANIKLKIEWEALEKGKTLTVKVKGMKQAVPVAWDVPKSPMQLEAEERQRQEQIRAEQQRRQAEEQARQEKLRIEEQKRQEEERKRQEKIWAEQRQRQVEEQAKQERIRIEEQRRQAEEQVRQQKIWKEQQKQFAHQERLKLQRERIESVMTVLLTALGKLFFLVLGFFFGALSLFVFIRMLTVPEERLLSMFGLLLSTMITFICIKKVFTFRLTFRLI